MVIYESSKCLPYVYICKHKETGQFYIGSRSRNVSLGRESHLDMPLYKTSSTLVKPNFDKFEWTILAEFFDAHDAYDFEQFLINECWHDPLILNKVNHYGKARFRRDNPPKWTLESRQKLSASVKGKKKPPRTAEHDKNIRAALQGKFMPKHTDETKAKMSEKALARPTKICPHCQYASTGNTIFRWHFDNCKQK